MPDIIIPRSFRKRLRKKPLQLQGAILECVQRLSFDPRYPGLQAHRVQGTAGVWEAYVDRSNRVTYHYEGGAIVMRNHCDHRIIDENP
jgi:hypothetical protein